MIIKSNPLTNSRNFYHRESSDGLSRIATPEIVGWPLSLATIIIALLDQTPAFLGRSPELTMRSVVIGAGSLILLLQFARITWLKWGRGRPSITIATFALGQTLAQFVASTVSPSDSEAYVTGAEHVLYQTVALTFAGWLIATIRGHHSVMSELESKRSNLMVAQNLGRAKLLSDKESVVLAVEQVLDQTLKALETNPNDAAEILSRASEDALRPLSHDLLESKERFTPPVLERQRLALRAAIAEVIARPLIAPRAMALVMTFLVTRSTIKSPVEAEEALGRSLTGQGLEASFDLRSLLLALMILGTIFLTTYLSAHIVRLGFEKVLTQRFGQKWFFGTLSIAAVAVLAQSLFVLIQAVLPQVEEGENPRISATLWFAPIAAVAVFLGIVRAIDEAQRKAQRELTEINKWMAWQSARINEELFASRRQLSQVIHGPIRAALLASSLEMGLGKSRGESSFDLVKGAKERIIDARARLNDEVGVRDLIHELNALKSLWSGTCEITFTWSDETIRSVFGDVLTSSSIHAVVEEAIANAIVHAKARQIDVDLELQGNLVTVVVVNDGRALSDQAERGLGSQLLDDLTTEWNVEFISEKTRLHAFIPVGTY